MAEPDPVVLILSTVPADDRGAALARTLVAERLVACVNLVPAVRSIYWWDGAIADDAEQLAVIKTQASRVDAAVARLVELHPYQVPEAVVVPVVGGHAPYLAWVASETV